MLTATQAIAEIADAIEAGNNASATDYDLEAILHATHEFIDNVHGYVQTVDDDEFWSAVFEHDTTRYAHMWQLILKAQEHHHGLNVETSDGQRVYLPAHELSPTFNELSPGEYLKITPCQMCAQPDPERAHAMHPDYLPQEIPQPQTEPDPNTQIDNWPYNFTKESAAA